MFHEELSGAVDAGSFHCKSLGFTLRDWNCRGNENSCTAVTPAALKVWSAILLLWRQLCVVIYTQIKSDRLRQPQKAEILNLSKGVKHSIESSQLGINGSNRHDPRAEVNFLLEENYICFVHFSPVWKAPPKKQHSPGSISHYEL